MERVAKSPTLMMQMALWYFPLQGMFPTSPQIFSRARNRFGPLYKSGSKVPV